jgi:hypothetical protein
MPDELKAIFIYDNKIYQKNIYNIKSLKMISDGFTIVSIILGSIFILSILFYHNLPIFYKNQIVAILGILFAVFLFLSLYYINQNTQNTNKYLLVLSKQFNLEDEEGNPIVYE